MRLGEGTGAAMAIHVLEASARILQEMATFGEAGVSEKGEGASVEDLPCASRDHKIK